MGRKLQAAHLRCGMALKRDSISASKLPTCPRPEASTTQNQRLSEISSKSPFAICSWVPQQEGTPLPSDCELMVNNPALDIGQANQGDLADLMIGKMQWAGANRCISSKLGCERWVPRIHRFTTPVVRQETSETTSCHRVR